MKKIGLLLLLPLLFTACGTRPKQIVNVAIEKLELVDNYRETLTAKESVEVLNKVNKRTVVMEKEKDLGSQNYKLNTKVTKNQEVLEEETSYYDDKNHIMYTQDRITNEWQKENIQVQDILNYSILTADDVEVEEVESDKTVERKYKIELSKESLKTN